MAPALPNDTAHPADARARTELLRAAAACGLRVQGGSLVRTSSRFCLSVEHGDYNGSELLGVGTDRFLWIAARGNDRGTVRLFSCNEPAAGVVEFAPDAIPAPAAAPAGWIRFALGAAHVRRRAGSPPLRGFDAVVFGDIPGGGMSRSASLSINLLVTLAALDDAPPPPPLPLARMAQAIENDYVGSPCGLLDQVVICHARRGHGVHFAPRRDHVALVPLGAAAASLRFVALFTGKSRHGLQHATYPVRRRECEQLAALLRPEFGVDCLAEVTPDQLPVVLARFGSTHPDLCDRLRYVHAAVQRFPRLLATFAAGDAAAMGAVFRADGHDLRDLYRISGPELETLCDIVRTVPAVHGERMLGGGDCGTAGALVDAEAVAAVRAAVAAAYPRSHPDWAALHAVHDCATADGIAHLEPLAT